MLLFPRWGHRGLERKSLSVQSPLESEAQARAWPPAPVPLALAGCPWRKEHMTPPGRIQELACVPGAALCALSPMLFQFSGEETEAGNIKGFLGEPPFMLMYV